MSSRGTRGRDSLHARLVGSPLPYDRGDGREPPSAHPASCAVRRAVTAPGRIVVCGAGAVGSSVAYFLTRRGARPLVVDRARPGAAASGKAAGFLALDWNAGTPLDELARASFALHRELANELGAERLGYRPMGALMTAAADAGDLERYRRLPNPGWLDGNVVAHEVIGSRETTAQVNPLAFTRTVLEAAVERGAELRKGVVEGLEFAGEDGGLSGVAIDGTSHPADVVVLALGPWTSQAQRWVALPQVFGTKSASLVLGADVPAQAVFSEFVGRDRQRSTIEMYPRSGGAVYVSGLPEHGALPDDPDEIAPSEEACAELHRIAGVHSSALRDAEVLARSACYRPLTVDGVPLIGPVPGAPGAYLATGHASWGILNAPATGRMVSEMILDGASHSVDPRPFALARLPAGRM
jgi:glycine/D-amino acid oxidase-like deaminating enzyme